MPARIQNRPRTPSGRLSRKFVPELPSVDLAAIHAEAAAVEKTRLDEIAEDFPDTVLYAAAATVDEANAALEALRDRRNRLVVNLWAFQAARGKPFWAAAGVNNMVFYRAKKEILKVDAIPKVPGTKLTVDWDTVRALATKAGIVSDPTAADQLVAVAAQIAEHEGRHKVAIKVRDDLIVWLVKTGRVTRAAAGRAVARDRAAVSRIISAYDRATVVGIVHGHLAAEDAQAAEGSEMATA